jgi:hypothetical protein
MSGGNDQWLRTPAARTLLLAALTISLVLGIGFVAINTSPDTAVSALGKSAPLTDDQSRAQVIESARQIVTIAQLRDVNGSYVFLSCTNEHDPPYQAALYLNFPLPDANSFRVHPRHSGRDGCARLAGVTVDRRALRPEIEQGRRLVDVS